MPSTNRQVRITPANEQYVEACRAVWGCSLSEAVNRLLTDARTAPTPDAPPGLADPPPNGRQRPTRRRGRLERDVSRAGLVARRTMGLS